MISASPTPRPPRVRARPIALEPRVRGDEPTESDCVSAPISLTSDEADGELLEAVAAPDGPGQKLLVEAAEKLKLSARGYHRVLRIARTLADLDGADLDGAGLCGGGAGLPGML